MLLKEAFESDQKLGKTINPSKCVDKLIDIRDELKDKCNCDKSDMDIVDQMLKVLKKDCEFTKKLMKKIKHEKAPFISQNCRRNLQRPIKS